jgi:hypothetical protein
LLNDIKNLNLKYYSINDTLMNIIDHLNKSLKINAGKSNRSEDLENYQHFFVDPLESTILEENTKHLIYGRRGSGKTLVIGALNQKIQSSIMTSNVMSFSYSALNFRSSAEYSVLIPTVKEKTHAYFHSFIEQLSHDVFNFADEILKKPSLLTYFKLNGSEMKFKRDKFVMLVLELLDAANYGIESPLPSSLKIIKEKGNTKESYNETQLGANQNATIYQDKFETGIKAYLGAEMKEMDQSRAPNKLFYESNRNFNPKKIKNLLIEFIKILDLNYLIIFIDEWMSLAECQIEFAERLKRSLFGERQISIKIAADPYQGQFNNSGEGNNFRGLEIGGDIFEAINLDLPFRDETKRTELFAEALYKRLVCWEPKLETSFGTPPNWNSSYFIESIFSNKFAFEELCTASQGLCRNFHSLFQLCAKRINWDLSKQKIDMNCVRKVIIDRTEHTYGRIISSIDSNRLLFGVIRPHIMNIRSRYFLVESIPSEYSHIIKNLLSKRIIHQVPMSQIHSSLRGEYDCFEIEYGIFLDIAKAMEFSTGEKIEELTKSFNVSEISSANKNIYILNLNENNLINSKSEILVCENCQHEFPSDAKAYVVRKICPYCFIDQ